MVDIPEFTEETPPFAPDNDAVIPDHSASQDSPVTDFLKGKRRERKQKEKPQTPPMPRPGVLKNQLEQMYVGLGMLAMPFDPYCANSVIQAAPETAKSIEKLCRTNPVARRWVMKFLETSVGAEVFIAHMPIIIAVTAHHSPLGNRVAGMAPNVPEAPQDEAGEAA